MADPVPKKDFFISYNKADRTWAEWIAWQLEEAGHTVTIQAWDFGPAGNFVIEMDRAIKECGRVLAVLSPTYLTSLYTLPEWAAYFANDPTSAKRSIVPVRVRECELKGLLAPIVYVDLLNKSEDEAKELLLDSVKIGRRKPASAPAFPGHSPARTISRPSRFPGEKPAIWNVPHNQNPNFTEPGTLLTDLRPVLHTGQPTVLAGLGGMGKTQLATEYAYAHAADYDLVWWLRADQPETLRADYARLATALDLPEKDEAEQAVVIAAVREALRRRPRWWLLVFDNAENPRALHADFLPGMSGHTLVTSRNPNWGALGRTVEVKKWRPGTATAFLLKRTAQADDEAATNLAQALDYLPLALEQAAAYIESTGETLASYLEKFRRHRLTLLQRSSPGTDYPATVATTWEISFQRLETESPAGAALLYLCAFLAPDAIPRAMIAVGAEHLPAPLNVAVAGELSFDDAVAAVRRYSLLECGEGETFSLHRLVQAVVRERLGEEGRQPWAEAAVRVASKAFPFDNNDHRTWDVCARHLPHATAATDLADKLEAAPVATAELLDQMGGYARRRAEYASAQTALERALRIGEKALGPEHPNVAVMVSNLGKVLRDLADLPGARAAFERALHLSEKAHGPEHPNVATMVSNLGGVLRELGDLPGARASFERALRIDEQVHGSEHLKVAIRVNNLGNVLRDLDDLPGAKAAYERALRLSEKAHGPEHPNMATTVTNLGSVLRALGDLPGARAALERALHIGEQVYGSKHPNVAITVNNLARVLQAQGDLPGARAALKKALAIFQRFLGDDHPHTKIALKNLRSLES